MSIKVVRFCNDSTVERHHHHHHDDNSSVCYRTSMNSSTKLYPHHPKYYNDLVDNDTKQMIIKQQHNPYSIYPYRYYTFQSLDDIAQFMTLKQQKYNNTTLKQTISFSSSSIIVDQFVKHIVPWVIPFAYAIMNYCLSDTVVVASSASISHVVSKEEVEYAYEIGNYHHGLDLLIQHRNHTNSSNDRDHITDLMLRLQKVFFTKDHYHRQNKNNDHTSDVINVEELCSTSGIGIMLLEISSWYEGCSIDMGRTSYANPQWLLQQHDDDDDNHTNYHFHTTNIFQQRMNDTIFHTILCKHCMVLDTSGILSINGRHLTINHTFQHIHFMKTILKIIYHDCCTITFINTTTTPTISTSKTSTGIKSLLQLDQHTSHVDNYNDDDEGEMKNNIHHHKMSFIFCSMPLRM